jgi:uncharacterized damage-inducible protein DinB
MIDGLRKPDQTSGGPLAKLGGQFQFNSSMLELLAGDFQGEDWSPTERAGNSAHWILGHLCTMRLSLLRTLGIQQADRIWEPLFAVAGDGAPVKQNYPTPRDLLSSFRSTNEVLFRALDDATPKRAESEWNEGEFELPVSVEDCVGFFYFDETFHLGQLGLARQQLGKPPVI